jgi:hypothetical protein
MKQDEVADLVWRIIGGMPVEVFDEESDEIWENSMWELVDSRIEGDFAGTRAIGSANLVTALNMVHQKMLIHTSQGTTSNESMKLFNEALEQLQERKLIRRKPERVRETFRVITSNTAT